MTTVQQKVTERLRVEVTLTVIHSVSVQINADSDQTIDQLKQAALEEFHRDPMKNTGHRSDNEWRRQFGNRTDIHVGQEQVSIAAVHTVPRQQQVSA